MKLGPDFIPVYIHLQSKRRLSSYEAAKRELATKERIKNEMTTGRRLSFYYVQGNLGLGNFSKVKLAYHILARERVAIKMMDKTALDRETARVVFREIPVLEQLNHPNIVRIYEVVETFSTLNIVLEYCPAGDLQSKIATAGRLSEKEARPLVAQIVSAFEYMVCTV